MRGKSYERANNSLANSALALYDESCNRGKVFLTCESKQDSISEVVGRLDEGNPHLAGRPLTSKPAWSNTLGCSAMAAFFVFMWCQ